MEWRSEWKMQNKKPTAPWCSQAVSHPSTIRDQCCLTSVIRQELVCSTWYGRWQGNFGKNVSCKLLAYSLQLKSPLNCLPFLQNHSTRHRQSYAQNCFQNGSKRVMQSHIKWDMWFEISKSKEMWRMPKWAETTCSKFVRKIHKVKQNFTKSQELVAIFEKILIFFSKLGEKKVKISNAFIKVKRSSF